MQDISKRRYKNERVQANKSTRGMPWHWEPKKDVISCDKPRGGANSRNIRGFPNGETSYSANGMAVYCINIIKEGRRRIETSK